MRETIRTKQKLKTEDENRCTYNFLRKLRKIRSASVYKAEKNSSKIENNLLTYYEIRTRLDDEEKYYILWGC